MFTSKSMDQPTRPTRPTERLTYTPGHREVTLPKIEFLSYFITFVISLTLFLLFKLMYTGGIILSALRVGNPDTSWAKVSTILRCVASQLFHYSLIQIYD